jgi:flagellar hook-associated protein 3 FlgL
MSLRTPNPFNSRQTLLDLQKAKERYAVVQEQISTGKQTTRLGDDPTGAALVIDFKSSVERNNQYLRSLQSARNLLQTSETSLSGIDNSLQRLLELGQQGLNGTTGANGRSQIATEVDNLRTSIIATANTQSEGKYIFAGTKTTTQPFDPTTSPITFAGDSNPILVDVSMGSPVATNLAGDAVFLGTGGQGSSTDIFQAVTDLRDGLKNNDMTLIQKGYDNIRTYQSHLSDMVTELGGRQSSLTQVESNLGDYTQSLQAIQGSYEDLDYAKAITEFNKLQNTQQVALNALGRMSRQSLFDYLG